MKVSAEVFNCEDVDANGGLGVDATLQFLLPASGSRPERNIAGCPSAVAAEMRADIKASAAARECKPFL
jgi:hypothetical protein